jgi:hypothetical protein
MSIAPNGFGPNRPCLRLPHPSRAEGPSAGIPRAYAGGTLGQLRPAQKRQASVEPVTVESLVKAFGAADWTRCVLRDSARGELRVAIAHRRVWVWDGEEEP